MREGAERWGIIAHTCTVYCPYITCQTLPQRGQSMSCQTPTCAVTRPHRQHTFQQSDHARRLCHREGRVSILIHCRHIRTLRNQIPCCLTVTTTCLCVCVCMCERVVWVCVCVCECECECVYLIIGLGWTHRQHEGCVPPLTPLAVDVCPTLLHQGYDDGHVAMLRGHMQRGVGIIVS